MAVYVQLDEREIAQIKATVTSIDRKVTDGRTKTSDVLKYVTK